MATDVLMSRTGAVDRMSAGSVNPNQMGKALDIKNINYAQAAHILEDGSVEFTPKGRAAIEAMFQMLDSDSSGGLGFHELQNYFVLMENVELAEEDFEQLDDLVLTGPTGKPELSFQGFEEFYRVVYETDVATGDARLQKDLAVLGLEHLLILVDATSILMGKQTPSAATSTSMASRTREQPKSTAKRKQPQQEVAAALPLVFTNSRATAKTSLPVVDLSATSPVRNAKSASILPPLSDDVVYVSDSPVAIPKKEIHPFFSRPSAPSTNPGAQKTGKMTVINDDIVCMMDDASASTVATAVPKREIHPFFLKTGGDASVSSNGNNNKTMNSSLNEEVAPPSSFAAILQAIRTNKKQKLVDFPPPALNNPEPIITRHTHVLHMEPMTLIQDEYRLPNHADLWNQVLNDSNQSSVQRETKDSVISLHEEDSVIVLDGSEDKKCCWPEKHRPQSSSELIGNQSEIDRLREWLVQWFTDRSRTDSENSVEEDDDDIIGGSDDDADVGSAESKRTLLMFGPSGSGKTCSLYACAQELGFRVFEVNASDDRSKIKQLIGEASQSYGLSRSGRQLERPLILVDEFETGFEDDPNYFLNNIKSLVKTARAPVVFICDDELPRQISTNGFELDVNFHPEMLRFARPNQRDAVKRLSSIVRDEALNVPGSVLGEIAEHFNGDIRACINSIHFWKSESRLATMSSRRDGLDYVQSLEEDGIDQVLVGSSPLSSNAKVEVSEIKPRKLNRASEEFEIVGRNFRNSTTTVECFVNQTKCLFSQVESSDLIRARLVGSSLQNDDSHGVNKVERDDDNDDDDVNEQEDKPKLSSEEEEELDEEELDFKGKFRSNTSRAMKKETPPKKCEENDDESIFEPTPPPFKRQRGRTGSMSLKQTFKPLKTPTRQDLILRSYESKHVAALPLGTLMEVTIAKQTNDEIASRHNSLYWCLDEASLPRAGESGGTNVDLSLNRIDVAKELPTFGLDSANVIKVDLDQARRNLAALDSISRQAELISLVDCVSMSRRGPVGDFMESQFRLECGEFSNSDRFGEDIADAIMKGSLKAKQKQDCEFESRQRMFVQNLREMYLKIDSIDQSTSCYWLDIPFYIRMSRLDEMRRVGHTGRRGYLSYFGARGGFDWLKPSNCAALGLKDLDLGWEDAVFADSGATTNTRPRTLIVDDELL